MRHNRIDNRIQWVDARTHKCTIIIIIIIMIIIIIIIMMMMIMIIRRYSNRRMLTMEWVDGVRLTSPAISMETKVTSPGSRPPSFL